MLTFYAGLYLSATALLEGFHLALHGAESEELTLQLKVPLFGGLELLLLLSELLTEHLLLVSKDLEVLFGA